MPITFLFVLIIFLLFFTVFSLILQPIIRKKNRDRIIQEVSKIYNMDDTKGDEKE